METIHLKQNNDTFNYYACNSTKYDVHNVSDNIDNVTCKNCQRTEAYKNKKNEHKVKDQEHQIEKYKQDQEVLLYILKEVLGDSFSIESHLNQEPVFLENSKGISIGYFPCHTSYVTTIDFKDYSISGNNNYLGCLVNLFTQIKPEILYNINIRKINKNA